MCKMEWGKGKGVFHMEIPKLKRERVGGKGGGVGGREKEGREEPRERFGGNGGWGGGRENAAKAGSFFVRSSTRAP